ncbi:phospholipase A2 inhibitor NAI-like [Pelobates fuscus]|uniref:phospholipase A2 inhibitor NAI-like n=1 Tax=Pelobates fuscus TaxID=191477 RepID=UPI002FE43765
MSSYSYLCVLLAIIPTGFSLQCIQCSDPGGQFCNGIHVNCGPASDVCMSSLIQEEINTSDPNSLNILQITRTSSYRYIRDCGTSSDCDKVVILRTPYNRMVTSNRCCRSNLCTPESPRSIPEGSQNGVTCPGCLTFINQECAAYKAVYCRGDEKYCFHFSSKPLKDDNLTFAMKGCATQSACNLELEFLNKVVCTDKGHGLDLSLLVIATCLGIKLLY